MPQRNRERIMQQSLYDLLCSMNEQLDKNSCNKLCIMECFMHSIEAWKRCAKFGDNCKECIQAWMNEYPF